MRSAQSIPFVFIVAAIGLTVPANAECETHIEPVVVDGLVATGAGITNFDIPFLHPVSLQHVTVLGFEALTLTTTGSGTSFLSMQPLSGGVPVGELETVAWLEGGVSLTVDGGMFIDPADQEATVDALRLAIDQSSGAITTTLRGIHAFDTVNVWFFVGGFAPEGPHQFIGLGSWAPVTISGGETTGWNTENLPLPLSANALHAVGRAGSQSFSLSGEISASIETQLLFDNGVVLTMDDWSSPSQGQAPPDGEQWISTRAFLGIDEEMATMIEGADLTGLRWRCHAQGSGSATFAFTGAVSLVAYYHTVAMILGDTNADAAVDVQDLVNVILDWGTDGSTHGGDVDESGNVDVQDLTTVVLNWGPCE